MTWTPHPEYNELPEAVKACVSLKEFTCMGDEQRRALIEDLTMPEVAEDV